MFRVTLSGLRYRTARLALSSLATALGVAFVSGTLVMGASMNRAFFNGFAAGARNVSAAVIPAAMAGKDIRPGASGAPSLPPAALAAVAATRGTATAAGRLVGAAPLLGPDGKVIQNGQAGGIGVNVAADPALRGFTVASGQLPRSAGQVAVDQATAADEHFRLGQTVRVVDHTGQVRAFTLAGTLDFGVNHSNGNATVAAFATATAFDVTGRPGYDQIVARAAPGVSQATLAGRLRARSGLAGDQVLTGKQLANSEASAAVHFTQQFTTASWSSR
ncbi:MAG TPA: ABC transporter permease [Streptosporangiaceae bacterium]